MGQTLPGVVSTTLTDRKPLIDNTLTRHGEDVILDSGNVDTGTPTYRFRPGNVIVKRTSTGRYVEANDANGDRNTAASVASLVTNPGSGGWDGDLVISGHWGTLTVALSGDDTDAAVAAAIIAAAAAANPESKAPITAADTTGEVTISNFDTGEGTWLHVQHATVTTAFGAAGTSAAGRNADYRVTKDFADLEDQNGTATHCPVANYWAGHFDESELLNLTGEARAVLAARGSRFG